VASQAILDTFN